MLNHIDIIGRVIRDPDFRTTPNGVNTTSFAVSVERDSNQRDERGYRLSDIFNIVTWRQTAEYTSRYIHKGDNVGVSGRLQIRNYTDRDGNRRDSVEIVADNVYSVGNRRDNSENSGNYESNYSAGNNSGSAYSSRSYEAPRAAAPAAPSSPFAELSEDEGELPF